MDPIPSSSSAVEREQPLVKADHKDFYLNRVFIHYPKSFGLVFVRKRETALRLAETLSFGSREAYAVFNGSTFDREFELEIHDSKKSDKEIINPMALVITEQAAMKISVATQPGKGVMLALSLATHTQDHVKVEKMIGDSELPPYFTEEDRLELFRRFKVIQELAVDALTYGRFENKMRASEALRNL